MITENTKQMNDLFLTYHKYQIYENQMYMLFFKTYPFITFIYIKKGYKYNKLRIVAPACYDEYKVPYKVILSCIKVN